MGKQAGPGSRWETALRQELGPVRSQDKINGDKGGISITGASHSLLGRAFGGGFENLQQQLLSLTLVSLGKDKLTPARCMHVCACKRVHVCMCWGSQVGGRQF